MNRCQHHNGSTARKPHIFRWTVTQDTFDLNLSATCTQLQLLRGLTTWLLNMVSPPLPNPSLQNPLKPSWQRLETRGRKVPWARLLLLSCLMKWRSKGTLTTTANILLALWPQDTASEMTQIRQLQMLWCSKQCQLASDGKFHLATSWLLAWLERRQPTLSKSASKSWLRWKYMQYLWILIVQASILWWPMSSVHPSTSKKTWGLFSSTLLPVRLSTLHTCSS